MATDGMIPLAHGNRARGENGLRDERFGRLYAASSQVSRAVMRSQSRDELLQETVRVLVEAGEFAMAFVAWHNPETQQLVPVACFGDRCTYTEHIAIYADERPEGRGPAGVAFRSGQPYVCNDFLNDPRTTFWHEAARDAGWQAAAGFPIFVSGIPRGILAVYSEARNTFGPDEMELLGQVTMDVGFGVAHLDGEQKRRNAELALAESERHLKLAIDAALLGTYQMDPLTGHVAYGVHCESMFGYAPGEFAGDYATFETLVHPDDLAGVRAAIAEARRTRAMVNHEFRVRRPDGTERWLVSSGGFMYSDSGEPMMLHGVLRDITRQKAAEIAKQQADARLEQALQLSQVGIFERDYATEELYWSPRLRAIHGWGEEEPVSVYSYFGLAAPEDRERIAAAIRRAEDPNSDGRFDIEHAVHLRDGTIRWTRTRAQTFFSEENGVRRPARVVGAVQDVTDQRRAEAEQRNLAALVDRSRNFIAIATLDGCVTYMNPAAITLTGLQSPAEAGKVKLCQLFAKATHEKLEQDLCRELGVNGYWQGELLLDAAGSCAPIDVDVTAFHLLDRDGKPAQVAMIVRDIRDRKWAEKERARLEERLFLAQKMEALGRLAGGVAHDFNNLLTVINGYSELLLLGMEGSDPLRGTVEEIHKAGERAAGLTRQLTAFSRRQVLQPRALDVNHIIRDMRPMLERLLGKDIELRSEFETETATVNADPHQLEQIVMNLAVNARDAMPKGGVLRIETMTRKPDPAYMQLHPDAQAGPYVCLRVTDTGTGMDAETQLRIFEPFFTTKAAGEGTGLGLATVEGIVAQSGGHVSVHSVPGHGTSFEVNLPALTGTATEPVRREQPAVRGEETIVVAEDVREVRDFTVAALKNYGYHVLEADSASEALSICARRDGHIHLVLSDVVMPNLSGPEMAITMAKLYPRIPVLLMSGYADKSIDMEGLEKEGYHFIAKPFRPEDLARKVREVLDGRGSGSPGIQSIGHAA